MVTFTDRIILQFLQDTFVEDLLAQLGLATLFSLTYQTEDIEIREITFAGLQKRQFQMPVFETIRRTGTEERIIPSPERWQLNYAQSRLGRLAWIDVFLEVLLATKVQAKRAAIERISTKSLISELGGVDSLADLKTKLQSRYPASIVDAFFQQFSITSIEDFKQRGDLYLEFFYKEPPPFDPNDPKNARTFSLNVCIKFQAELKIVETLQDVKLCRSILENEKNFVEVFDGGEIKTPYAFLVIFADSAIADNSLPAMTASQAKTSIKDLFASENILVHFLA